MSVISSVLANQNMRLLLEQEQRVKKLRLNKKHKTTKKSFKIKSRLKGNQWNATTTKQDTIPISLFSIHSLLRQLFKKLRPVIYTIPYFIFFSWFSFTCIPIWQDSRGTRREIHIPHSHFNLFTNLSRLLGNYWRYSPSPPYAKLAVTSLCLNYV